MDHDSPITTLLIYSAIILIGSVAAVVAHSWLVTTLFCFAVISWGLRLLLQVKTRRRV